MVCSIQKAIVQVEQMLLETYFEVQYKKNKLIQENNGVFFFN